MGIDVIWAMHSPSACLPSREELGVGVLMEEEMLRLGQAGWV